MAYATRLRIQLDVKLRVQTRKGGVEVVEVGEVCGFKQGVHQNAIVCADGSEYFFTQDGYYDGWGKPQPPHKDGS